MRGDRSLDLFPSERAVSDVVAFTFVFAIIITSVGLVTVVGFSVLEDIQKDEQALNAERAFQSLGYNLGNVERGHAPGRSGEVQLNGGALYVEEKSSVTVTVSTTGRTITRSMGTLYYDMIDQKTNVTYEGGAVFREDPGGEPVMVSEPNFRCDTTGPGPNVVLLSLVELKFDDTIPGGEGTVQVIGREQSSKLPVSLQSSQTNPSTNVDVTITDSRFIEAWERYLENNGWSQQSFNPSSGDGEWRCGSGPIDVFVRHTVIDINFVTG